MSTPKTVVIVDDHPLFREGLRSLIDRSPDYKIIGEAGTGREAIQKILDLEPDLVTMDVTLPDMSGVQVTQEVKTLLPSIQVVMVSMHPNFEIFAEAFKAGAMGYVVKESTSENLILALDKISRGENFLDGNISHEVVNKIMNGGSADEAINDERYGLLTPREQQVMRMVVDGMSSREVAEQLNLSPKTVENHRNNLMKKLQVHNQLELIRYATKLGLIDVDTWKDS